VTCITGNGLKTTDVLAGAYETEEAIRPRLTDFENYINEIKELNDLVSGGVDVR